ncbi:MAG: hypothetical protein K6F47_06790 [Bacteroidaceae bacterium]|nr:hypothetical protein [Bacteroidaceae bacterium]
MDKDGRGACRYSKLRMRTDLIYHIYFIFIHFKDNTKLSVTFQQGRSVRIFRYISRYIYPVE